MAFVPVPNGFEVVFTQNLAGRPVVNVLHYQHPGGLDLSQVANDMFTFWADWMILNLSSQLQLTEVSVRDVRAQFGDVGLSTLAARAGTGIGEPMPANVACLVRKKTGKAGRHRQGRMYLSGLVEGYVGGAGGNIGTTQLANIQSGVDSFVGNAENIGPIGDTIDLVVVSRYQGVDQFGKPIPRAEAVVTPITAWEVDDIVATQRDRLR